MQRRDFVSVHDVARAWRLARQAPGKALGCKDIAQDITRQFRVGDIRHCFAGITLVRRVLDYAPRISLQHGLEELVEWIRTQNAQDRAGLASMELAQQGLKL